MTDRAKKEQGAYRPEETEQRRDELLRRLLHTPPQPRPKRERDKSVTPKPKKPKKEAPAK